VKSVKTRAQREIEERERERVVSRVFWRELGEKCTFFHAEEEEEDTTRTNQQTVRRRNPEQLFASRRDDRDGDGEERDEESAVLREDVFERRHGCKIDRHTDQICEEKRQLQRIFYTQFFTRKSMRRDRWRRTISRLWTRQKRSRTLTFLKLFLLSRVVLSSSFRERLTPRWRQR
jgi:hypothetical protein